MKIVQGCACLLEAWAEHVATSVLGLWLLRQQCAGTGVLTSWSIWAGWRFRTGGWGVVLTLLCCLCHVMLCRGLAGLCALAFWVVRDSCFSDCCLHAWSQLVGSIYAAVLGLLYVGSTAVLLLRVLGSTCSCRLGAGCFLTI